MNSSVLTQNILQDIDKPDGSFSHVDILQGLVEHSNSQKFELTKKDQN